MLVFQKESKIFDLPRSFNIHNCKRTRRSWKPNVQSTTLWSDLLQQSFKLNVTTCALRNINKYGGLDNYLIYNKDKVIDSVVGEKIKSALAPVFMEKKGILEFNQSKLRSEFLKNLLGKEERKK